MLQRAFRRNKQIKEKEVILGGRAKRKANKKKS